ncbi:FtsX-like permease family protein [Metabacillus indicus]|uniref:ABC transporter permease n=1 Tax=Metabacillus indicus TaxID=246786 RepID=UPI002A00AE5C|nr:FtsX-like permease family protein [Metabacillus indicus]MDX8291508.1 FtsX-like permease family protein [Metabacillus indicus]
MKFRDQLSLVRRNMKKNRMRVFMTVLATTIGCAFLIVLASVGFGMQKSMQEELLSAQKLNEIQISGKETDAGFEQGNDEQIKELEDTKNVAAVVRRSYATQTGQTAAKLGDRTSDFAPLLLTSMENEFKANLKLDSGKAPKNDREVIVGHHFASSLLTDAERKQLDEQAQNSETAAEEPEGYQGELIGKEIVLTQTEQIDGKSETKSWTFTISGITAAPSRDYMDDFNIYISDVWKKDMQEFAAKADAADEVEPQEYNEIKVYTASMEDVKGVTDSLKDKGYLVYSITEELENMNLFFNAFKAGLIFVGTVAVLIASIGIFNTMTMAVTERTQEIGIMKAIGAQPGVIRRIFLLESAFIGLLGALLGVIIAYAVSFAANFAIPLVLGAVSEGSMEGVDFTFSYIPLSLVLIAGGISLGVALISGLRPAVKATNINVLSALRREL